MNDDLEFEAWKRARATGTVPPGFADRVMRSVARGEEAPPRRAPGRALLRRIEGSALGRVLAVACAAALFLGRILGLFAVFAS